MESLVSVHNSNKSDLLALSSTIASPPAASTSAPTINPLLSRIKLKAKPKKLKKKVEAIKASELKVVSTAIGHTDVGLQGEVEGEEQVVLDLADELLDMLDEQEANDGGGQGQLNEPNDQGKGLLGGGARISIAAGGDKKLSRQALRKLKKIAHFDEVTKGAQAEVAANNDNSIAEEKTAIDAGCVKLGVEMKEMTPDGHCLFSAIADQVNRLGLSPTAQTYASTRSIAANYMRSHPDEFKPFLLTDDASGNDLLSSPEYSKYCDNVEKTAVWGGHLEILALAKSFTTPVHILQAGTDIVKVGDDDTSAANGKAMLISYHRKMYGLGEHYNSLVPQSQAL